MQSQRGSAVSEGDGRVPFAVIIHFHESRSTVSPQSIFCKQLRREVEYHHTGHCAAGRAEDTVPASIGSSAPAEPALRRALAGEERNSATGSGRAIAAFARPEQAILAQHMLLNFRRLFLH